MTGIDSIFGRCRFTGGSLFLWAWCNLWMKYEIETVDLFPWPVKFMYEIFADDTWLWTIALILALCLAEHGLT